MLCRRSPSTWLATMAAAGSLPPLPPPPPPPPLRCMVSVTTRQYHHQQQRQQQTLLHASARLDYQRTMNGQHRYYHDRSHNNHNHNGHQHGNNSNNGNNSAPTAHPDSTYALNAAVLAAVGDAASASSSRSSRADDDRADLIASLRVPSGRPAVSGASPHFATSATAPPDDPLFAAVQALYGELARLTAANSGRAPPYAALPDHLVALADQVWDRYLGISARREPVASVTLRMLSETLDMLFIGALPASSTSTAVAVAEPAMPPPPPPPSLRSSWPAPLTSAGGTDAWCGASHGLASAPQFLHRLQHVVDECAERAVPVNARAYANLMHGLVALNEKSRRGHRSLDPVAPRLLARHLTATAAEWTPPPLPDLVLFEVMHAALISGAAASSQSSAPPANDPAAAETMEPPTDPPSPPPPLRLDDYFAIATSAQTVAAMSAAPPPLHSKFTGQLLAALTATGQSDSAAALLQRLSMREAVLAAVEEVNRPKSRAALEIMAISPPNAPRQPASPKMAAVWTAIEYLALHLDRPHAAVALYFDSHDDTTTAASAARLLRILGRGPTGPAAAAPHVLPLVRGLADRGIMPDTQVLVQIVEATAAAGDPETALAVAADAQWFTTAEPSSMEHAAQMAAVAIVCSLTAAGDFTAAAAVIASVPVPAAVVHAATATIDGIASSALSWTPREKRAAVSLVDQVLETVARTAPQNADSPLVNAAVHAYAVLGARARADEMFARFEDTQWRLAETDREPKHRSRPVNHQNSSTRSRSSRSGRKPSLPAPPKARRQGTPPAAASAETARVNVVAINEALLARLRTRQFGVAVATYRAVVDQVGGEAVAATVLPPWTHTMAAMAMLNAQHHRPRRSSPALLATEPVSASDVCELMDRIPHMAVDSKCAAGLASTVHQMAYVQLRQKYCTEADADAYVQIVHRLAQGCLLNNDPDRAVHLVAAVAWAVLRVASISSMTQAVDTAQKLVHVLDRAFVAGTTPIPDWTALTLPDLTRVRSFLARAAALSAPTGQAMVVPVDLEARIVASLPPTLAAQYYATHGAAAVDPPQPSSSLSSSAT
ncbi:hypothetical protein BC828DRAFT_196292 [Blastocladiella britannica]|nr:hypothetical protein BC828DRAFT_196292 [Blastocladiella britannica]